MFLPVYITDLSWLSLFSLMRFAAAVVLIKISWARANPWVSCLLRSFCTTIAERFSASWVLIWFCSSELNDPMILFRTCSADLAWMVVNTKCPVSESKIAFLIHSKSLISPNNITSGLCLRLNFIALEKLVTSFPSSFWSIILSLGSKIYSIGSSIVKICFLSFWLISSIIAASVVDFPLPVAPASKTIPFSLCANSLKRGGSQSFFNVGISSLMSLITIMICPLCLEILTLYLLSW